MGCDGPHRLARGLCFVDFNPRTHMGCDLLFGIVVALGIISIHAPTWGATIRGKVPAFVHAISIHAPTWGATCCRTGCRTGCRAISIHAPTWGATGLYKYTQAPDFISIHAPTWGATAGCPAKPSKSSIFQSTHPHGVRPEPDFRDSRLLAISIHAPTWGATKFSWSQSRCDQFQSTHPHGVRRAHQRN